MPRAQRRLWPGAISLIALVVLARAHLLHRLDRRDQAAAAYRRAADLTGNPAERAYLEERLRQARPQRS